MDLPGETVDERRSWLLAIVLLAVLGITAGVAQLIGPLPRQAGRLATAQAHLAAGDLQGAHDAFMDLAAHATTSHEDFHKGLSGAARLDINARKTFEAREHLDALNDALGSSENSERLALEARLAIRVGKYPAIVDALHRYQASAQGRGDMELMELAQARLLASGHDRIVVDLYTSLLAHAELSTNTVEVSTMLLMRWPQKDQLEKRRKLLEGLLSRGLSDPLAARVQQWLANQ